MLRILVIVLALGLPVAGYVGYRCAAATSKPVRAVEALPAPGLADSEALTHLSEALEQERSARLRLETQVAALARRLDEIGVRAPREAEPVAATDEAPAPERPPAEGFDEEVLVAGGFDERQAARLRERFEEIQLDGLYLFDQAKREGWVGSERFRQESAAITARYGKLEEEVGEETYDWVLYAAGRPNRVRVKSVLALSPAQEAGLQPGDVLTHYDAARIFTGEELVRATGQGNVGETVLVEFERGGERGHAYVPRGPLGVRVDTTRNRPTPIR